jgi:hypothetical protein
VATHCREHEGVETEILKVLYRSANDGGEIRDATTACADGDTGSWLQLRTNLLCGEFFPYRGYDVR